MLCRKRRLQSSFLFLLIAFTTTTNCQTQNSNARSYDTNDWIPVSRPSHSNENGEAQIETRKQPTGRVLNLPAADEKRFYTSSQDGGQQYHRIPIKQHADDVQITRQTQKVPQFFPQEQIRNTEPYRIPLKPQAVSANLEPQPLLLNQQQQKYQQELPEFLPTGGQQGQILLPPQLQSLIAQDQSFLNPHKINSQLLPQQQPQIYQPTVQTLPVIPTQNVQNLPNLQNLPILQNFPINDTEYSKDIIQNINLGLYQQSQQVPQIPPTLQTQTASNIQNVRQNNHEPEEVQLLYVPLENLRQKGQRQQVVFPTEQNFVQNQQQHHQQQHQQQFYQNPQQHKQVQLQNIEHDFVQQALQAQKLQEQFQHHPIQHQSIQHQIRPLEIVTTTTTTTTTVPTPKKRKPHQPPLAVYMGTEGHPDVKIGDVLTILKDAKTISVQDTIGPDSPQVFVGPSHLEPPEGYAKFELPYLSSIENNRVERKVDQLPFFVAPLSYKAPQGYSKISFPAPHVGSVIINNVDNLRQTNRDGVSTELPRYIPSQIQESTSPRYTQSETSTIRTRGRQRQPNRGYSSSTARPPVTDNIPYGPFPTKSSPLVQQSSPESLISANPYGPTQFVQSSTPSLYEKSTLIPEQIFTTKNRFSTASSVYNQNIQRHQDYNEPTQGPSTVAAVLNNNKYTVLEEFSVANKHKEIEHTEPISQHHSRRPIQETIEQNLHQSRTPQENIETNLHHSRRPAPENNEAPVHHSRRPIQENIETALPLVSTFPAREQYIQNQEDLSQSIINKQISRQPEEHTRVQIPLLHYHEDEKILRHPQALANSQISNQQSSAEYETPVTRQRGQKIIQENYYNKPTASDKSVEYTSQEISSIKPHITRGRNHFKSEDFYQDDDEPISENIKSNEQHITVTKEPLIEYHVTASPSPSTQYLQENVRYSSNSEEEIPEQRTQYTLPSKLPPISPQLPGLVNSLQEHAIRPLLAPLLLPAPEPPAEPNTSLESSEEIYEQEHYASPSPSAILEPSTTRFTTTTTTTTQAPIIETTTQYRRTRTRQRGTKPTTASYDYVSTTPSSRKNSAYRGRRPYSDQTRSDYTRQRVTSTTQNYPETVTESNRIYNRNRQVTPRNYISSTTEQSRRSTTVNSLNTANSRQRFKTRGRPVKSDKIYAESTTAENVPAFRQPVLESGFHASAPSIQQNIPLQSPIPTASDISLTNIQIPDEQIIIRKPQKEQALLYVEHPEKHIQTHEIHIPKQYEQVVLPTESVHPIYQSTIAPSAPENNLVPDVAHNEPTVLINHEQSKYSTETNIPKIDRYSNIESTVNRNQQRYEEIPDSRESSTEYTRQKTRTRSKPRSRIQVPARVPSFSSTTTVRTTTAAKQERQEEEFYGFFRQPNFGKAPAQMEYKESAEIRPAHRVTPTVTYIHQTEEPIVSSPRSVYRGSQTVTYLSRSTPSEEEPVVSSPRSVYRGSQTVTYLPKPTPSEEPIVSSSRPVFRNSQTVTYLPKPSPSAEPVVSSPRSAIRGSQTVTYLPRPSEESGKINYYPSSTPTNYISSTLIDNNRADSNIQSQYISSTISIPSASAEYNNEEVKPVTRRPNSNFRVRRPQQSTTASSEEITRSAEKYYTRPTRRPEATTPRSRIQGRIRKPTRVTTRPPIDSRENYSSSAKSNELEEQVTPIKSRQRLTSRGRLHFHGPGSESSASSEEPEEENYPINFLKGQEIQPTRNTFVSSTQLPVKEIITPRPVFRLTIEPEESEEIVDDQVPNYSINKPRISSKELEDGAESIRSAKFVASPINFNYINSENKQTSSEEITKSSSTIETTTDAETTEETKVTELEITTIPPTTELPTTIEFSVTEKPKNRRRGVWKLVKTRPISDEFESAESQNVGTVFDNNLFNSDKPIRKYHTVKRIRIATTQTTSPLEDTTTTQPLETTIDDQKPKHLTTSPSTTTTTNLDQNIFAPLYEMFGFNSELEKNIENTLTTETSVGETGITDVITDAPVTNSNFELSETTTLTNTNATSSTLYEVTESEQQKITTDKAWQTRIIGTSTTTEISHETEICYRGRCVKSASTEDSSESV